MTEKPTVFIIDDDAAVLESLAWLMKSAGLRCECFDSARAFLEAYDPGRAGCAVVDIRMPGLSGLELQHQLRERKTTIPVIIITGHADTSMAVYAMKDGAFDFIEKPIDNDQLLESIRQAIAADEEMRARSRDLAAIQNRVDTLSPTEGEVMALVVKGMTSQEIAQHMHRSIKTIETHRKHIMSKMKAERLAVLVRMVMTLNLTGPEATPVAKATAAIGAATNEDS